MKARLSELLRQVGIKERVRAIRPVSGGSISRAYRVQTESELFFFQI